MINKTTLLYLASAVSLFAFSASVSYFVTTTLTGPPGGVVSPEASPVVGTRSRLDPSLPRTEVCPLTGAKFTTVEREVWEKRRPLGVMVENHVDSRPTSGVASADIVYEAVAEGGITRFMGVFYCGVAAENITFAPVRSARIYYVNLISEYDGLYNHVGGAGNCDDPDVDPRAKALCAIDRWGIKSLNQFYEAGAFKTCHRVTNRLDREVDYEHTMSCFSDELYQVADKLGWANTDKSGQSWDRDFTPWKFKAAGQKASGSPATSISYMFWEGNRNFNKDYDVGWNYQPETDSYQRHNGGEIAVDHNTGGPLAFNNVVVQFVKQIATGDREKHLVYEVVGQGKAIVFMDGVAIPATWSKSSRTDRTIFKDAKSGAQIKFTPGPVWVSLLPVGNTVEYNP